MAKTIDYGKSITPAIEAPHISKTDKEATKEMLDKFIQEETKMVKGRFRNIETPGASAKILVRKYKGHEFEKVMEDGKAYEIPLYVARHLQGYDVTAKAIDGRINSCAHPVHQYSADKDMFPTNNLDSGVVVPMIFKRRYAFESMEFENAM